MNSVQRLRAVALALPFVFCTGCLSLQEECNDTLICARNCSDSWHAWIHYRSNCPDESYYPHHYGKGFRAGYRDVASGGEGCPPTLPPSCYWSVCYQNPAGQQKVQEWFRGWVYGANAARIDGVSDFNTIMTSERLFGRCGPQQAPSDVHYIDHESGWSSDGNPQTPTPATVPSTDHPLAPGAEIPSEPYFPNAAPDLSEPKAEAPQRELLQLLQEPEGPILQ
jgi:hypothetical protein